MKKLLFAAVAVFAFGVSNAQEVKFGAKAGLNLSNFSGDAEGTSTKVGFQVGALAEIMISDKFAIQPELVYSSLGAKSSDEGFDYTSHLNYLNIPVMAKYFVAEGFSLEAGPQIGFLLSAKDKGDGEDVDTKEYYNSTDFGMNVGAGYDVTENINLGLRYTFGLSNIAKDAPSGYKVGNSNIAFAVAYKF
ncbi:PorT family protein [Flavobacterium jejuense]|uniref:PorT family protein n=1 Tax=Flavobacterium jejuense TaxID=1544455 RepID=A0ABX0IPS5_9FLAO|nr:porin family protein [Flavobacterium jejuense]NHN25216.1 PorT family protein [Flavobacterium jejuense]